jgi:hypothetical protein
MAAPLAVDSFMFTPLSGLSSVNMKFHFTRCSREQLQKYNTFAVKQSINYYLHCVYGTYSAVPPGIVPAPDSVANGERKPASDPASDIDCGVLHVEPPMLE